MQPNRITVNVNEAETYLYMPCFTNDTKGTKILTLSEENYKCGLPMIQGIMILNNPRSGEIECIIDGASVTAYRTGAVGGVGVKYTSPEDCVNLGIVGTGVQAFYQAMYASFVRNIERICVYDVIEKKCEEFAQMLSEKLPGRKIVPAKSPEELVEKSEIVITVTPSLKPVLPEDKTSLKGKHFVGIGSYKPAIREYPETVYSFVDKIYIDVDFAIEESGDLSVPLEKGWFKKENIQTLYSAIKAGGIDHGKTTFYKSVGMALFDIMVARNIYEKAKGKGIGQSLRV
jgi:ornithine cyclodeaminase